jgi:hypothetical protein
VGGIDQLARLAGCGGFEPGANAGERLAQTRGRIQPAQPLGPRRG